MTFKRSFSLFALFFCFVIQSHSSLAESNNDEETPDLRVQPCYDTGTFFPRIEMDEEPEITVPTISRDYRRTFLPRGDIFKPLIADIKEHQFYASIQQFNTELIIGDFTAATVGFGENFGVVRWQKYNNSWQIGIVGGLFAQFNIDTDSTDLINADYTLGAVLSRQFNNLEYRVRLIHQSTHLGDEYLLRNQAQQYSRVNFSMEALDGTACYNSRPWRFCGGGQYILNVWPDDYDRFATQLDAEYRSFTGPTLLGLFGRYVAGLDVKLNQEQEWNPNISVKAGLEFGEGGTGRRRMRVMLEGYDGYVPFGQFYHQKMSSFGIGVYLGF